MFNILFSLFFILLGIRMIYVTNRHPSGFYNQNLRGYFAGTLFIILSIISLTGKFNLFKILSQLIKNSLKLKPKHDVLIFITWIVIVCSVLFLTYYRPDKMINKYRIAKEKSEDRIKLLSGYILFYFGFLIVVIYLIEKLPGN